jgi:23S rRNA maturation-related 3'-5' exoribonuclease YhaM
MGELSIQEAMHKFLNSSRLKSGVQAVQIEEVWGKIMGKTVAKYTDKLQIIGTTLFITSTVAPLKNELLYQKENIIALVNEALGDKVIKEVVVK